MLPGIGKSRATLLFVAAVLIGLIGACFVAQRAGRQSHDARPQQGGQSCADNTKAGRLLDGGGSSSGSRGVASRPPPRQRRCVDDGWGGREGWASDRCGAAISHCRWNVVDRGRDAARTHRPHGDPAQRRPCSCRGRPGEEAAAAQLGRDLRPGSRPMGFDGATTGRSVFAFRHAVFPTAAYWWWAGSSMARSPAVFSSSIRASRHGERARRRSLRMRSRTRWLFLTGEF